MKCFLILALVFLGGTTSCGSESTPAKLTGPTDITLGMKYTSAEAILLGGGAIKTGWPYKPTQEDTEILRPFDLPDGTTLLLSERKTDGRIVMIHQCLNPTASKEEYDFKRMDKYTVDPGRARLRRLHFWDGMAFSETAEYLRESGAVQLEETTKGDQLWRTYRLADGRELKFWIKHWVGEGFHGTNDIQVRKAGQEWASTRVVWLTPDGKKPD